MTNHQRAYLYMHIAILLWGFTAILGDLISVSALSLVWWRVLLSALALSFWPKVISEVKKMNGTILKRYACIGVLVGLHWLAFYGSIKIANASIALIALSTAALFTSLIEPLVFRTRLEPLDMVAGLLVIPAMMLISFDFSDQMLLGLGVGIISAAFAAYFTVLNKYWSNEATPETITFIEMSSAWLTMSFILMVQFALGNHVRLSLSNMDIIYLVILAIGCTILPFVLHLKALQYLSAFTSNLMNNLEPVYGIVLAALILDEHKELEPTFYIGVMLLMSIVFLYPWLRKKLDSRGARLSSN